MAVTKINIPPQKVRLSNLARPLNYVSNGVDAVDIKGGFLARYVLLDLQFVMASGSNLAVATLAAGGEWGVAKRIKVKSGSETLADWTGEELRVFNMLNFGIGARPQITLGATSTTVKSTLVLPFSDFRIRKPIDMAVNTSKYGNLQLEITWGTHTDVSSDATSFTTAPTITASVQSSTGYKVRTQNGGVADGQVFEHRMVRREFTNLVTGFNRLDLTTGLVAYRSLLIYAKTSGGVDDPGKNTDFRMKSLTTTLLESTFRAMRDNAFFRAGIRDMVSSAGVKYSPMQETGFSMDNWLYIDFAEDGLLSEALPTFRINDLYAEVNCPSSAPNKIIVVGRCIIPPPNQ